MRKVLKVLAVVILTVVAIVLVAMPFAAPPLVKHFAEAKLKEFGVASSVRLKLGYCWRNGPGIEGTLRVSVPDTPWRIKADFGASCCEWSAKVSMPETELREDDALIRTLLEKFPLKGVKNLSFSGSVGLDATAERTFRLPVPVWNASVRMKRLGAGLETETGQKIAVSDFSVAPSASGIADRVHVSPVVACAKSVGIAGFTFTNLLAKVRMTGSTLTADSVSAGFCGGNVGVYSLFFDSKSLNTGFTLLMDNIDAGEVLPMVNGFHGEASGRLHGKIKMFVRKGGQSILLRDAFLYSTPGEKGKVRVYDPQPLTDSLAYAGIDVGTRDNVAEVLTDLDYYVLRLELARLEGENARLTLQVMGTATRGDKTVPADIKINLNGELNQLLNTGLGYSSKMKGKKKK